MCTLLILYVLHLCNHHLYCIDCFVNILGVYCCLLSMSNNVSSTLTLMGNVFITMCVRSLHISIISLWQDLMSNKHKLYCVRNAGHRSVWLSSTLTLICEEDECKNDFISLLNTLTTISVFILIIYILTHLNTCYHAINFWYVSTLNSKLNKALVDHLNNLHVTFNIANLIIINVPTSVSSNG